MAFIENEPSDPTVAPAELKHPDGVDKVCSRCAGERSVYKCNPPIFSHSELCAFCHDFVRAVLVELQRAAMRLPEPVVAAMITEINARSKSKS